MCPNCVELNKQIEILQDGIRQLQIENAGLMAELECAENDIANLEWELQNNG